MSFLSAIFRPLTVAALLALSACATANPDDLSSTDRHPKFNRAMHDFNVALDRNLLRPAAQGYDFVTPTLFKHLIGNAFNHLELPGDFVNFMLQGEIDLALETLGRFTINTVMGIGVLDPATEFGLAKRDTDFGVTMGKNGVAEGDYWVLPLIGPTNTRDAFGRVVQVGLNPLTYLGAIDGSLTPEVRLAARGVSTLDERDRNADVIDDLLYESADSYISLRSVYLQRRRALVAGEEAGTEALPDIFETN